jgi:hypothetical protein
MFATNVDCIACHRKAEGGQAALHTSQYAERAIGEACVGCHGEGFDETLKRWKALLSTAGKRPVRPLDALRGRRKDHLLFSRVSSLPRRLSASLFTLFDTLERGAIWQSGFPWLMAVIVAL